jgi:hypothetical protein
LSVMFLAELMVSRGLPSRRTLRTCKPNSFFSSSNWTSSNASVEA